jgi:hypothetical protein
MSSRLPSSTIAVSFQQRAEEALSNLVDQGLVTGVRASVQDGKRRVEVSVSLETDENAPDFDRGRYDDARRRVSAALPGVEWVLIGSDARA